MNQTHGPHAIREVAPLHDLSITLHGVRASVEARSLSGQSVDQSDVAGNLVLRIGGLTTSEVLILDLDRQVEGLVSLR